MDTEKISISYTPNNQGSGFNITYLDSVTSTNDYLKNLAEKKYPHGTVVCAETQTQGRGRNGRVWYDSAGKCLTFSILLRPEINITKALIYSFLPAIFICRFLREQFHIPATVKWPNDIYVDGRKLAGILCETTSKANHIKYLIVGYGINISQQRDDFPVELQDSAISLFIMQKKRFDKQIFLINFLSRLTQYFHELPEQWEAMAAREWNSLCYHINSHIHVYSGEKNIAGIFRGISETGEAIVETEQQVLKLVNFEQFSLR